MAQATGIPAKDLYVAISTDNSNWTDISGSATNVEPDGGDRKSGEFYTFDTDYAGLTRGKREPIDVKVSVVYTEGGSDAWAVVNTAYEGNTALYVRWSPKGNTTGNSRYTTGAGIVTSMIYPKGEAESPDAIMCEMTLRTALITKSAVP
jgi:hypothetical protein